MYQRWRIVFMSRKEVYSMYEVVYQSVFSDYFNSFCEQRIKLGYSDSEIRQYFKVFDNYFYNRGIDTVFVTESIYNDMMDYLTNENGRNRYRYASKFSMLMKYMSRLGVPVYIPRVGKIPKNNFMPYIFTHDELCKIFKVTDHLRLSKFHSHSIIIIMPAILRMLYSTAMRIGEALALKNEDVDLDSQTITIKSSKNRSQRIAPINPSLKIVLKQYVSYRNQIPVKGIENASSPFFVNLSGDSCSQRSVLARFIEILQKAGIAYKGHHQGPRIHDLRHTACVHAMVKLVKEGKDIYCAMPYIAAYMGHKTLEATNNYLRLTKEVYPDIIKATQAIDTLFDNSVYNNFNHEDRNG